MKISRTVATISSLLIAILLTAALSVTGVAQSASGSISGTVKDTTGAAVVGAEVSLVHAQSVLRTTLTNSDGKFSLDNVAPGSYAVIVRQSGFGRFSDAVQVKPGDRKDLDSVLEVNPLSEEVTASRAMDWWVCAARLVLVSAPNSFSILKTSETSNIAASVGALMAQAAA